MGDSAVCFVGPSWHGTYPKLDGIRFHEPARRGDLLAAARQGSKMIGFIDGVFGHCLSVSPREVNDAHDLGCTVVCGGSMGALRACDCPETTTGIGIVYRLYRSGVLSSEDEVAGTYLPETRRTIAWPLVSVRFALRESVRRRMISKKQCADVVERLGRIPFSRRTIPHIRSTLTSLAAARVADSVANLIEQRSHDPKWADARAVLAFLIHSRAAV